MLRLRYLKLKGQGMKKEYEVCQANSFIESRQTYSVNEKRLLSTLISFVKPKDTELVTYEISIQEWAKTLGVASSNLYHIADEITTKLMMKIVEIKNPKNLKFKKWHVLETSEYDEGVLTLKISKEMNDIFLKLQASKNFTHYELTEFVTLTSTHAQRIYELLKQYQHSKQRSRTIMLTELKKMLGIEKKYKEFKFFRRDVLDIALKQIEKHTTLRYEWRGIKRGRSYNEIEFYNIHITGKEEPTELQEKAMLDNYIDSEIYNNEINNYFTIKSVKKLKSKILVTDKFNDIVYEYDTLQIFQDNIAKAMMNNQPRLF